MPNIHDANIQAFENTVLRDLAKLEQQQHHRNFFFNLSRHKIDVLNKLAQDEFLVFKEADKGRSIVIQNRNDYLVEVNRQLNSKEFYESVSYDPSKHISHLIKVTIQEASVLGYINENLCNFF